MPPALRWLIYPLTVLALIHAFIQAKIDVSEEVLMSGIFLLLIGVRWLRHRAPLTPLWLIGLVISTACAAMIVEFAWYALATGLPAMRLLMANFNPDLAPRPALIVLLIGLVLPMVAWVQPRASRAAPPRAKTMMNENS